MTDDSENIKEERYRIYMESGRWIPKSLRKSAYVNFWHCSSYESAAMWKLYLKSEEGIAIQSTTKRLSESMVHSTNREFIAYVKYVNFETEAIENPRGVLNKLDPIVHKRISFEHEKEMRSIIYKPEWLDDVREDGSVFENLERATPPGINTPVVLNTLIEAVYLAPTTSDWFHELVKSVSSKYSVDAVVHRSSLSSSPII